MEFETDFIAVSVTNEHREESASIAFSNNDEDIPELIEMAKTIATARLKFDTKGSVTVQQFFKPTSIGDEVVRPVTEKLFNFELGMFGS